MNNSGLWNKNFLLNSSINFFIYLVFYVLIVTITAYASNTLLASPSEAGLASGIFIVGALVARIFAGRSIEQIGRKKMLYGGLTLFLFTTVLYFAIDNLFTLFVIRFLHGVGLGISATATATIIAGIIPPARRGEGISYYAMSITLAAAVGPFFAMQLNSRGNFTLILILSVILAACSLFAAFSLNVPELPAAKTSNNSRQRFSLQSFFEKKSFPISSIAILIGLSYSSILSFLTSYVAEIDLLSAGSLFYFVYSLAVLLSRPLTGRWFDRNGDNFVMYPSFFLFAAGLLLLSQAQQGVALLSAAALVGLGYGTFMSCAQAISIKQAPPQRIGLATSTYFIFLDAGIGIGPFLLGLLIPVSGFRGLYAGLSVVALLCALLYHVLHGRRAGASTCCEQETRSA